MISIVIYGKGGVGKSTVATHLSVTFQQRGHRVLLVGCDPKTDTSARVAGSQRIMTMVDMIEGQGGGHVSDLIFRTPSGVDAIETGGPEPGLGCSGRGVISLCQLLREESLEERGYDVVVFDVLGDLVCGGFIAPLQFSFAKQVYIVSSEEVASLFAANNVAKVMTHRYLEDIVPGGIVFNLRGAAADRAVLEQFAQRIGVGVAAYLDRDPVVLDAEIAETTAVEYAPDSDISRRFVTLAESIEERSGSAPAARPTPLSHDEFWEFVKANRTRLRS